MIRAKRELSTINEQFGFIDKAKQKMDFLGIFQRKVTQLRIKSGKRSTSIFIGLSMANAPFLMLLS